MIITLVFITGAPGLHVKQIYHNVEIACKELLFALSRKEGIHNTVSYMIYLPKHHLDLVDDMYDRFPNKKYISPKISFVRRWGIRKKATGGKKCLRLQKNYKNDSQLFKYSLLFNVLVIEINLNF